MKKLFAIAAILILSASSAFADSVTVEATHLNHKSNSVTVIPSVDVFGVTVDARLEATHGLNGLNTNQVELRVGKTFQVSSALSATAIVGAGKANGTEYQVYTGTTVLPGSITHSTTRYFVPTNVKFYSAEVGLKYELTSKVAVKVSDRYTHPVGNSTNKEGQHEFGLAAEYAVTPKSTVGVKVVHLHGRSNGNGAKLSYTRSF